MGKKLRQQKRGKGSPSYRVNSFRFVGKAKYKASVEAVGVVSDIVNCPGHSSPLIKLNVAGEKWLIIGGENMHVGQEVTVGGTGSALPGDIKELGELPPGAMVYNLEARPGDGGKFVRASGTFAKIVSKSDESVSVKLPSKAVKKFNSKCRATIGRAAGSGRVDKPIVKAGKAHHKKRAKGGIYPRTSGVAMNAVDHPYGGSSSAHKGTPTIAPKNAPPGRKVGKIRPRRTGYRR